MEKRMFETLKLLDHTLYFVALLRANTNARNSCLLT